MYNRTFAKPNCFTCSVHCSADLTKNSKKPSCR